MMKPLEQFYTIASVVAGALSGGLFNLYEVGVAPKFSIFFAWTSLLWTVLLLTFAIAVGGIGILVIALGKADYSYLTYAKAFPVLGIWVNRWSKYRAEEKRIREEEATTQVELALTRLEAMTASPVAFLATLEELAEGLRRFQSPDALNDWIHIKLWQEILAEALKQYEKTVATKNLYRSVLAHALHKMQEAGEVEDRTAEHIRAEYGLQGDAKFNPEGTEQDVGDGATTNVQWVTAFLPKSASSADKVEALLQSVGITLWKKH